MRPPPNVKNVLHPLFSNPANSTGLKRTDEHYLKIEW